MMDGKGRFYYSDGAIFDGFMKQDEKHGVASYRWAGDGALGIIRYVRGEPVGEGVRWSADRRRAYRLEAGKKVEKVSLDEAANIRDRLREGMEEGEGLGGGGGGGGGGRGEGGEGGGGGGGSGGGRRIQVDEGLPRPISMNDQARSPVGHRRETSKGGSAATETTVL